MKELSIGESRPKKFKIGAESIKWFEKVNFSHTFILFFLIYI